MSGWTAGNIMFAERCILPISRNSFPNWYELPRGSSLGAISHAADAAFALAVSLQPAALFSAQIA